MKGRALGGETVADGRNISSLGCRSNMESLTDTEIIAIINGNWGRWGGD